MSKTYSLKKSNFSITMLYFIIYLNGNVIHETAIVDGTQNNVYVCKEDLIGSLALFPS